MRKAKDFSEEELASATGVFFQSKGWELYPEVVLQNFGGRVDLVATKQQLCAVIECKKTFSYPVLEQLTRWRHEYNHAERSDYSDEGLKGIPHLLIAVVGGEGQVSRLKKEILQSHRIGLLQVTVQRGAAGWGQRRHPPGQFNEMGYGDIGKDRWRFLEVNPPKLQPGSRRLAHNILRGLNPDMRQAVAGASGRVGGYMTPFKRTLGNAKSILASRQELHIVELVRLLNSDYGGHHYCNDSSAQTSISKFLVECGFAERPYDKRPVLRMARKSQAEPQGD